MLFNFKESSRKRRALIHKKLIMQENGEWDKDILLNVLILGAMKQDPSMYAIKDAEDYNSESLEVELRINGVELDLEKGLERLLKHINDPNK